MILKTLQMLYGFNVTNVDDNHHILCTLYALTDILFFSYTPGLKSLDVFSMLSTCQPRALPATRGRVRTVLLELTVSQAWHIFFGGEQE